MELSCMDCDVFRRTFPCKSAALSAKYERIYYFMYNVDNIYQYFLYFVFIFVFFYVLYEKIMIDNEKMIRESRQIITDLLLQL